MNRWCVFATALMITGLCAAQAPEPPRVPPPPGSLEGQVPPSGALLQGPRAQPPSEPPSSELPESEGGGRQDAVATRNTSASWLWVTIYEGDRYYTSGCVKPEGELTWSLRMRPAAYRIRGEMTRNAECKQPVACDTSFRREPGMTRLEFASAGSGCSWRPARDAGPLKTPGVAIYYEVYNATPRSMWITIYEWGVFRDTIIKTHCLKPGKRHIWAYAQSTVFRAEMTRDTNCQQSVACDTGKKALRDRTSYVMWDLKANGDACWWATGGRPYNWREQLD